MCSFSAFRSPCLLNLSLQTLTLTPLSELSLNIPSQVLDEVKLPCPILFWYACGQGDQKIKRMLVCDRRSSLIVMVKQPGRDVGFGIRWRQIVLSWCPGSDVTSWVTIGKLPSYPPWVSVLPFVRWGEKYLRYNHTGLLEGLGELICVKHLGHSKHSVSACSNASVPTQIRLLPWRNR